MNNGQPIQILLEKAQGEFLFSAYQLVVYSPEKTYSFSGGTCSYWDLREKVSSKTYFDLASLTKPLFTVSVIAKLVDTLKIEIEKPVEFYDPFWRNTPYGTLLLTDLLAHCSGLRDWFPFFQEERPWKEVMVKNPEIFILNPPRRKTQYSDLGFLVLGSVIEAVTQLILHEIFSSFVKESLGLNQIEFGPISHSSVAATEWRGEFNRCLKGESFDENAAHFGGVAPHAGLFGTAEGVLPICEEWLKATQGKSAWLSQKVARLFTKRAALVSGSSWALGWDLRSFQGSSAGNLFSEKSFGHLGFTGTSIWIDPVHSLICIFLTNRVHPSRLDERVRRFRSKLHDEVFKFIGKESHENRAV